MKRNIIVMIIAAFFVTFTVACHSKDEPLSQVYMHNTCIGNESDQVCKLGQEGKKYVDDLVLMINRHNNNSDNEQYKRHYKSSAFIYRNKINIDMNFIDFIKWRNQIVNRPTDEDFDNLSDEDQLTIIKFDTPVTAMSWFLGDGFNDSHNSGIADYSLR